MKNILTILLVLISLFSCMEDKSNYDYIDINEISFESLNKIYEIPQGAIPMIDPGSVTQSITVENDNIDYLWLLGKDTICNNRIFNEPILLSPGTYDIEYVVVDKNTGIFKSEFTKFLVTGTLGRGLVVLSNIDGRASLSYLSDNESIGDLVDFVPDLGMNPVKVAKTRKTNKVEEGVLVMCNNETGGTYLDGEFNKISDYKDLFFLSKENCQPQGFVETSSFYKYAPRYNYKYESHVYSTEFLVDGGEIYERYAGYGNPEEFAQKFNSPLMGPDENGYEASPIINTGRSECIVYDRKNRRILLAKGSQYYNNLQNIGVRASDEQVFDHTNIGDNMELILGETGCGADRYAYYYYVFNDGVDSYLHVFYLYYYRYFRSLAKVKLDDSNMPIVPGVTKIATSVFLPVIYYTKDRSVEAYNVTTNSSYSIFDNIDTGEIVTDILYQPALGVDDSGKSTFVSGRLFISTKGSSDNGMVGNIYEVGLGINNTVLYSKKHSNIAGEIVSMAFNI